MKPLGLMFKDPKLNPFTQKISGELAIVHQCLACGKISKNRIAGDDNTYSLLKLLNDNRKLDNKTLSILTKQGINLLKSKDKRQVGQVLLGCNYRGLSDY
ncbi:hypothetical protein A2Z22_01655 [Candidatus Woesebacteria bacterium RBG_16_34_12]|uniref:RNHCP domain-containing protein n=1 Tax=Candidatus Woesebacteria bacterium RBG_16_34_12 TaxID=1802480 RepID=A0A1F7XAW5_9BACT|nr:MAG: hypothetical protein A2Z22_01655 [Candidatus Woesebacteria bacterium RBG_16_34_12]